MAETEYTRLHITPFNPSLLNVILPPSILPNAKNISFHEIQTFPEKGYGYVDLPVMDAEKIKKKLNGTILKGTKVRIEKAKPVKEVVIEEEEPEKPKRDKKKRKRDELPGVDIGERHVKRGWTVPAKDVPKSRDKEKKMVVKSKFTTEPECLFKTNLPANVASKTETKTKEEKPDKKKRKLGKEVVVHEFTKTTKYATFLRGSSGSKQTKVVAEFVEGQGWIDEDGNVVEELTKKTRKPKEEKSKAIKAPVEPPPKVDFADASASEEEADDADTTRPDPAKTAAALAAYHSSSDESSSDEEDKMEDIQKSGAELEAAKEDNSDDESSSDSSSDSSSSEDESDEEEAAPKLPEGSKITKQKISDEDSDSSSDDSSSSDESDAEEAASSPPKAHAAKETGSPALSSKPSEAESSSESSSDSSSESESDDDSEAESESETENQTSPQIPEPQSAISARPSSRGLSITIPPSLTGTPISTSTSAGPSALKALFGATASSATETTSKSIPTFSLLSNNDDIEEDETDDVQAEHMIQVPLTPYTKKDFEWRGMRSAAPTPDTAHANKRFIWPNGKNPNDRTSDEDDEEEDEEEARSSPSKALESKKREWKDKGKFKEKDGGERVGGLGDVKEGGTAPETDFQKWFWENRGDTNRSWKKRRKVAGKEQKLRVKKMKNDRPRGGGGGD